MAKKNRHDSTGSLFVEECPQAAYGVSHVLKLCFDGGCAGPNAHAYGSYVLWLDDVQVSHQRKEYGDQSTSNVGEWTALRDALEDAISRCDPSVTELQVKGDSMLVVHGAAKRWKVKAPHLRPIAEEVWLLTARFAKADFTWWGRENTVRILGH